MDKDEKLRFLKSYKEETNRVMNSHEEYDLRKEMKKYCYDNCFVLSTAFGYFDESMIKELLNKGVEGIVQHQYTILADTITLPRLVIHQYVGMAMPEKSLAIVPNGGYDIGKCASLKEYTWLVYLDKQNEKEEGPNFVPIWSRYCSGLAQKQLVIFFLDGFRILPNGSRECYEFYGCYYQGCPNCFPNHSKVVQCKRREYGYHTVEMAYQDTTVRELEINQYYNLNQVFTSGYAYGSMSIMKKKKSFMNF